MGGDFPSDMVWSLYFLFVMFALPCVCFTWDHQPCPDWFLSLLANLPFFLHTGLCESLFPFAVCCACFSVCLVLYVLPVFVAFFASYSDLFSSLGLV